MKIAITGATGFIGQHVRNVLAKTDNDVVLVVRYVERVGDKSAREEIVAADLSKARTDWFELFGRPDVVLQLQIPKGLAPGTYDLDLLPIENSWQKSTPLQITVTE